MKKQGVFRMVVLGVVLFSFGMAGAAEIKNGKQNAKLKLIEEQIAVEEKLVEDLYQQHVLDLLKVCEDKAKKIKTSYRMLWLKYYDMMCESRAKDDYILNASFFEYTPCVSKTRFDFDTRKTPKLRAQMINSYSLYKARTFLLDENARDFIAHIANNSNYGTSTSILRSQAREVLKIMDNLQSKLLQYQQNRERALANLKERETALKNDTLKQVNLVSEKHKGIVGATSFSDGGWIAMVGDKVVREGEMIGKVKVEKISAKQVSFVSGGAKWSQKIGEHKSSYWE